MNETCNSCGKPIHWSEDAGSWYHDELLDTWNCPTPLVAPVQPAEV